MDTKINGIEMRCPPNYDSGIEPIYSNEFKDVDPFEISLPCTCTPKGASIDWHDINGMIKGLKRMAEIYRNPKGCGGYKCIHASV